MRIFFTGGGTGGHLYPALAIARAIVELEPGARPYFVGAKRGVEREILPGTEFEYSLLELHPIYRSRPWNNWRTVAGLAGAWRTLGNAARAGRPVAVVGTGGYASGAALAWAVTHRVPIVVPLPTAAADHQTFNAIALAKTGAALHLSQADLTRESLGATVAELLGDPARLARMSSAALGRARPDAAKVIARRVLALSAR